MIRWAVIPNTIYMVSETGQVSGREGKILTPFKDKDGYLVVNLSLGSRKNRKIKSIARLVAIAFIPNPQNKPFVNHLDGHNKTNNSIKNLEWSTVSENTQHAWNTGLISKRQSRPRDEHGKYL